MRLVLCLASRHTYWQIAPGFVRAGEMRVEKIFSVCFALPVIMLLPNSSHWEMDKIPHSVRGCLHFIRPAVFPVRRSAAASSSV
jgi:hypothetical protein